MTEADEYGLNGSVAECFTWNIDRASRPVVGDRSGNARISGDGDRERRPQSWERTAARSRVPVGGSVSSRRYRRWRDTATDSAMTSRTC